MSAKKLNSTIGVSHQENFTDTINQPYGPNRDPTGMKTKEFSETDYQNRNSSANKGVKRTDAISRRKNMQLVLAKNSENKPNASIAIDGNAGKGSPDQNQNSSVSPSAPPHINL